MPLNEFISTDTLKLTLIPTIVVIVVLFLWFRRSEPKSQLRSRREPASSRIISDPDLEMGDANAYFGPITADDEVPAVRVNRADPPVETFSPTMKRPADEWDQEYAEELGFKEPEQRRDTYFEDEYLEMTDEEAAPAAATADELQTENAPREAQDGMILVLNVVANGRQLRGSQLLKAITATGMAYGKMGIFHYHAPSRPSNRPLFSLANMMEPGSFNLATMEELSTPGLTLFANITRPEEALMTFNAMLETARKLANSLDAIVCDERRGTLSKQGIEHIYGQIAEFQRRSRLAQAANA